MHTKIDHHFEKEKATVIGRSKTQRTKRPTDAKPALERFIVNSAKNTQKVRNAKHITANTTMRNVRLSENAAATGNPTEDTKPVEKKKPAPIPIIPNSCSKSQIIMLIPFQNRRIQVVMCKGLL